MNVTAKKNKYSYVVFCFDLMMFFGTGSFKQPEEA